MRPHEFTPKRRTISVSLTHTSSPNVARGSPAGTNPSSFGRPMRCALPPRRLLGAIAGGAGIDIRGSSAYTGAASATSAAAAIPPLRDEAARTTSSGPQRASFYSSGAAISPNAGRADHDNALCCGSMSVISHHPTSAAASFQCQNISPSQLRIGSSRPFSGTTGRYAAGSASGTVVGSSTDDSSGATREGSGSGAPTPEPGSAWMDRTVRVPGSVPNPSGPLAERSFILKDIYDVEGHITGYGSPDWRATHEAAPYTAPAVMVHPSPEPEHRVVEGGDGPVQALVRAGAELKGTAVMDEMAFSLEGRSAHYGTPRNAAAPGRIPGGSSSGCAAAVAGGEADVGLGTDTAGSVRVPASYCGLYGVRPSHERVDLRGCAPMAPSFDTGGWVARDVETLRAAGGAVLRFSRAPFTLRRWLVAADAFELAEPAAARAIYEVVEGRKAVWEGLLGPLKETRVAAVKEDDTLERWGGTFSTIQMGEVWAMNGEWVKAHRPDFSPGIRERYQQAAETTQEQIGAAVKAQMAIRHHVDDLLNWDGVLIMPTALGPPPALETVIAPEYRGRLVALGSIAGLCGLPQVTIPLAALPEGPLGVSLVGPRGADEALVDLAVALTTALKAVSGDP